MVEKEDRESCEPLEMVDLECILAFAVLGMVHGLVLEDLNTLTSSCLLFALLGDPVD